MKRSLFVGLALLVLAGILVSGWLVPEAEWAGVDEAVVEKFAKDAGRPPSKPLINTDQGDLLLFLFLLAGALGGFVAGYQFRQLFPPRSSSESDPSHV